MSDIVRGFNLHFSSFKLVSQHRRLLMLSTATAIVYLLLFLAGCYLIFFHLGDIMQAAIAWTSIDSLHFAGEGFFAKIGNYGLVALQYVAKGILAIAIIVALFIVVFVVGSIASAPIYDFLSEEIERVQGHASELPFSLSRLMKEAGRSIVTELQKAILFLAVPVITILLSLIPVIGIVASLIATNFFAALMFGFTFVDYPMARRVWTVNQRLEFCKKHWQEILGMGLVFFIPVVNFIATPIFVTTGTLLFLKNQPPQKQ